jgi:hypothetical protein
MNKAASNIRIHSLEDAQNIEKISKIFSHSHDISHFKPLPSERPILIIITGSPGVGKTKQLHHFLKIQGFESDKFYQVSLDSLVEHVAPYRLATVQLYDKLLLSKKGQPLDDKDYGTLSGVYSTMISSKKSDFGLPEAIERISEKIKISDEVPAALGGMRINKKHNFTKSKAYFERNRLCRQLMLLTRSLKESAKKGNVKSKHLLEALKQKWIQIMKNKSLKKSLYKLSNKSPNKLLNKSPNKSLKRVENTSIANNMFRITSQTQKQISHDKEPSKNKQDILFNLNEMRSKGFEYGVKEGVNIVYDMTLTASGSKVKDDIIKTLEQYRPLSSQKYLIKILLIKASPETIQQRIRSRHQTMIYGLNSYIRAINPNLKTIEKFIEENQKGFNTLKTYFTSPDYKSSNNSTAYTSKDFEFIEIDNE